MIFNRNSALILSFLLLFNAESHAERDSALTWKGYYDSDLWYGLDGGLKDKGRYLGKGDISLSIDFEKLIKLKEVDALIEVETLNGQRPNLLVNSIEGINSIQGFDNIEYDRISAMTYLYQLWLQKSSNKWSALIGLYDLNSEFYFTDSSQIFILPAFGTGTDLGQTGLNGPSIFPNPGSALRLKYNPSKTTYVQTAIFDAAAADPLNRAYPHRPFASGLGLLGIIEAGYYLGENQTKLALGSWEYFKQMPQQLPDTEDIVEPAFAINKGIYFMADTPLYANNDRIMHGFVRFGTATSVINNFNKSLTFGLSFNGFIPKRPQDVFAYGFAPAWTSIHSRWANSALPKAEIQQELTYLAVINSWLSIQPDLIYIRFNGRGIESTFQNAFLLGLRFTFSFDQSSA